MRLIYWMFFSIAQLFPACKPLCRQKFIFYTDFSIFPESACPFARKFDCSDQSFCDTIEKYSLALFCRQPILFFEGEPSMNHKMDFVRQSYSDIAQGKQDTILSSSPDQQALNVSVGYSEEEISLVPPAANMGLGCGNPFRIVEVKEGDTLIDLGSGAGFDCFLASHKVGRKGRVIGVDMTPEMLSLARCTAKENRCRNVEFRLGEIENLPAADNLADVVISNCVINLSQNKPRVYREILRVLKPGGAIGISDIVIMKELPKEIKQDDQMYAC